METIVDIRPFAKKHIQAGVTVIPLLPRQKAPDTYLSHPHQAHINKVEDVDVYFKPESNMGLVCGVESMNVIALDFDHKDDPKLAEMIKAFDAEHHKILSKLTKVITSGGCHYYLRVKDPSVYNNGDFFINDIKMGQVRTNKLYVVMPPSLHPNGMRYVFERFIPYADLPSIELHELGISQRRDLVSVTPQVEERRMKRRTTAPNALAEHLMNRFSKGKAKNVYVEKAIANTRKRILAAVKGERNTIINVEIYSLARLIPTSNLTEERIMSELYDDALSLYDPDDRDDASDIINLVGVFKSAIEAGMKKPKEFRAIGNSRR